MRGPVHALRSACFDAGVPKRERRSHVRCEMAVALERLRGSTTGGLHEANTRGLGRVWSDDGRRVRQSLVEPQLRDRRRFERCDEEHRRK